MLLYYFLTELHIATSTIPITPINSSPSNKVLVNGAAESFQSISCNAPYSKHSFEVSFHVDAECVFRLLIFHFPQELRVAYLLLGREATSDEIAQQNHRIRLTV